MEFAVTLQEIEKWTADMVRIPSYPGIPNQEMAVAKYIKYVFVFFKCVQFFQPPPLF